MMSSTPKPASVPISRVIVYLYLCMAVVSVFAVLATGYAPRDDALRHVGKVVSGKNWDQVIITSSGYDAGFDTHPGWHLLLTVGKLTGLDAHGLLNLSVVLPWVLLLGVFMIALKRPEAFLLVLLLYLSLEPVLARRLFLGRPFLISYVTTVALLVVWEWRPRSREKTKLLLAALGIGTVQLLIHPSWYLLGIPLGLLVVNALLDPPRWRRNLFLMAGLMAAIPVAALLSGHPVSFLGNNLEQLLNVGGRYAQDQSIVSEFRARQVGGILAAGVFLLYFVRMVVPGWGSVGYAHPAALLMVCGMIGGYVSGRFWDDWGLVGLFYVASRDVQWLIEKGLPREGRERLVLTIFCGCGLILTAYQATNLWDGGKQLIVKEQALDGLYEASPEAFPDEGGVVYASSMDAFYTLFFLYSGHDWRYALAFEPAIMSKQNLAIYNEILKSPNDLGKYQPWVETMHPGDRLVINGSRSLGKLFREDAVLGRLDWAYCEPNIWIGRPTSRDSRIDAE